MIEVKIKDIGKEVKHLDNSVERVGTITQFNDLFIFVKFEGSNLVEAINRDNLEYNIRGDFCKSCEYARLKSDMMILILDNIKYYFCTDLCLISFIKKRPLTIKELEDIQLKDNLNFAELEAQTPNR